MENYKIITSKVNLFPWFSPTRPTDSGRHVTSVFQGLSLSRSVGRVGENPENEVAQKWPRSLIIWEVVVYETFVLECFDWQYFGVLDKWHLWEVQHMEVQLYPDLTANLPDSPTNAHPHTMLQIQPIIRKTIVVNCMIPTKQLTQRMDARSLSGISRRVRKKAIKPDTTVPVMKNGNKHKVRSCL